MGACSCLSTIVGVTYKYCIVAISHLYFVIGVSCVVFHYASFVVSVRPIIRSWWGMRAPFLRPFQKTLKKSHRVYIEARPQYPPGNHRGCTRACLFRLWHARDERDSLRMISGVRRGAMGEEFKVLWSDVNDNHYHRTLYLWKQIFRSSHTYLQRAYASVRAPYASVCAHMCIRIGIRITCVCVYACA